MNKDRKSLRKKEYKIPVTRIGYGTVNIKVQANSQEQAENMALAQAGDHEFSEHSSDYVVAANATKQIINVIEKVDGSIKSIESFIVDDLKRQPHIVKTAEELFSKKALENACNESEIEMVLEEGYYASGDYELFITWSDNVH